MRQSRWDREAEVAAWRASGQSAGRFAESRGYSRASLDSWARAQRAALTTTPKFVRVEVVRETATLVVEVKRARIHVSAGFDRSLLRDVVAALGSDA